MSTFDVLGLVVSDFSDASEQCYLRIEDEHEDLNNAVNLLIHSSVVIRIIQHIPI